MPAPQIGVPLVAANLVQTGTGAAAAGVTLTLTAGGVGTFQYITMIEISMFATAALTAAATPVLVTTTNINNTPVFSMDAAATAQGVIIERIYPFPGGLKANAANTNVTIVAPATTAVIWRLNAYYYIAS